MPQATFWFASPFKDWIGQRSLTLSWDGETTLRDIFLRLAEEYPRFRANLTEESLENAMAERVAVILDGNFLSLDSTIPDGAKVDVLTPLSGGCRLRLGYPPRQEIFGGS